MGEMINTEMKVTQVTAAILRQNGKILICQRDESGSCPLLWEFPGGKKEAVESLAECLIRECREELGVTIEVSKIYAQTRYTYGEKEMVFTFFDCLIIEGEPQRSVHRDIRWVRAEELEQYAFCPADVEVAERLKLNVD